MVGDAVLSLTYTDRRRRDLAQNDRLVCSYGLTDCADTPRPARLEDYASLGARLVQRPDGSFFEVPFYSLADGLVETGFLRRNGERSQDYRGWTLGIERRSSRTWSLRAQVTFSEQTWNVPEEGLIDPNLAADGAWRDGAPVLHGSTDLFTVDDGLWGGRGWSYAASGSLRVAPGRSWGFHVSASLRGHEGDVLPYFVEQVGLFASTFSESLSAVAPSEEFRLDDVHLLDLRFRREFTRGDTTTTWSLEMTNVLDENTVLERELRLGHPEAGRALEALSPRAVILGVKVELRSP